MTKKYSVSEPTITVRENPQEMHAFSPMHVTRIAEANIQIDGKIRKYVAYDSNPAGSKIRLYYTDDLDSEWTSYTKNPILESKDNFAIYRWPSVVRAEGIFHMFLSNILKRRLERWTSIDGLSYKYAETIIENSEWGGNPFVWFDENTNKWYLYHFMKSQPSHAIYVRSSDSISAFAKSQSKDLLHNHLPFAAPSVLYVEGLYWLLAEAYENKVWKTLAFYSSSPDKDFKSYGELLTNDEACAMHFLNEDSTKIYLYISRRPDPLANWRWIEETRVGSITS